MTTLEQLQTLAERMVEEFKRERAEIEALRTANQRSQAETIQRNEQLVRERNATLAKVDTIAKQQDDLNTKLVEVHTLKLKAQSQIDANEVIVAQLEQREKDVAEKEKRSRIIDERMAQVTERESALDSERLMLNKQKELLSDKSKMLDLRETQLVDREERVKRVYS